MDTEDEIMEIGEEKVEEDVGELKPDVEGVDLDGRNGTAEETRIPTGTDGDCLVCGGRISSKNAVWEEFGGLPGSGGGGQLNRELWAVFILKRLLGLPKEKITELMGHTFGIPLSDWFGLCTVCGGNAQEAMKVYRMIRKLEKDFQSFQKRMRRNINESLTLEGCDQYRWIRENRNGVFDVRTEIRKYFKAEMPGESDAFNENDVCSQPPHEDPDFLLEDQSHSEDILGEEDGTWQNGDFDDTDDITDPLYIPPGHETEDKPPIKIPPLKKKSRIPMTNAERSEPRTAVAPPTSNDLLETPEIQLVNCSVETGGKRRDFLAYRCTICVFNRLFVVKSALLSHLKDHKVNKYPCPNCKFPCVSDGALKKHYSNRNCYPRDWKSRAKISPIISNDEQRRKSVEEEERTERGDLEEDQFDSKSAKDADQVCDRNSFRLIRCTVCLCKKYSKSQAAHEKHLMEHELCLHPCPKCKYPCADNRILERHSRSKLCRTLESDPNSHSTKEIKRHQTEPAEINVKEELGDANDESETQQMDTNCDLDKDKKVPRKQKSAGRSKDKEKMVRCKICLCRKYLETTALDRHMAAHTKSEYPCPKCKFPCSSEAALIIHSASSYCRVDSSNPPNKRRKENSSSLKLLKKAKRPKLRKDCDVKPTENRKKKEVPVEWLNCPICHINLKTITKDKLALHIKRHQLFEDCEVVDGRLKCKICGELAVNPLHLRRHTRDKHASELGLPVYQCDLCENNYSKKFGLEKHIATVHTKQFDFFCDICGYGATEKDRLDKHKRIHSSEKPFVCDQCAAAFKSVETLRHHIKMVHKSSRNRDVFKCKYCDASFSNNGLLREHVKDGHKDLYVHKCDECENTYLSVASLQLHKKVNHGDAKAECQFCHVKVLNQVYLYSHYQNSCKKKPIGFKFTVPRAK